MPMPMPIIVASEVDQSGASIERDQHPGERAADGEPGDGDEQRQAGGDHGAEHQQQDDGRGGEADRLGADLGGLALGDRSARRGRRRGRAGPRPRRWRSSSRCPRRARRPGSPRRAGRGRPGCARRARSPPGVVNGSSTEATCGSSARSASSAWTSARAAGSVTPSVGADDDVDGVARLGREARLEQLLGLAGVGARGGVVGLEVAAERRRQPDRDQRGTRPRPARCGRGGGT